MKKAISDNIQFENWFVQKKLMKIVIASKSKIHHQAFLPTSSTVGGFTFVN